MKKLMCLLIIIVVFVPCVKSNAYNGPSGANFEYEYVFDAGSDGVIKFYSNYLCFGVSQDNSNRPLFCAYVPRNQSYIGDYSNYVVVNLYTGRYTWQIGECLKKYPSNLSYDATYKSWCECDFAGHQSTNAWQVTWTPQLYQASNVPVFSTYEAGAQWAYAKLQPQVEWSNPQYNPNMPIPEISTNYNEITVNSTSPEIPFDINFVNPNNDYYIEIYCDYWIPDNMSISINRGLQNNDGYVYKALSKNLVSGYLIDPEQMLRIQGINNLKLQLQTNWENALTQVPVSALEYVNPNNLPSGMFTQYKNTYENYCRNILGFYGSQFTIMLRYFTIVNDTQYVVGAWRTWTTYSPNEFTERLPDYYVPYVPASGQENITNNVDPENIEIVQGTGSNTGVVSDPNYYITVNQNTPNYPDYPTIASYNKDNLLLDTMNHINSLSTFFGEFGDFLTTSFTFFPAWIWAIIGAGFGISIVVMFLKIL